MAWFWLTGTRTRSSYPVNPGNRTTLGETHWCAGEHHVSPLSLSLTWGGGWFIVAGSTLVLQKSKRYQANDGK